MAWHGRGAHDEMLRRLNSTTPATVNERILSWLRRTRVDEARRKLNRAPPHWRPELLHENRLRLVASILEHREYCHSWQREERGSQLRIRISSPPTQLHGRVTKEELAVSSAFLRSRRPLNEIPCLQRRRHCLHHLDASVGGGREEEAACTHPDFSCFVLVLRGVEPDSANIDRTLPQYQLVTLAASNHKRGRRSDADRPIRNSCLNHFVLATSFTSTISYILRNDRLCAQHKRSVSGDVTSRRRTPDLLQLAAAPTMEPRRRTALPKLNTFADCSSLL